MEGNAPVSLIVCEGSWSAFSGGKCTLFVYKVSECCSVSPVVFNKSWDVVKLLGFESGQL